MEHTYFYRSWAWTAEGTYYDESGVAYPLCGRVEIERSETEWTLDGYLEVEMPQPVLFTNCYNIRAGEDALTLLWESFNPALGALQGRFEVVGDSILSHYVSRDQVYSGCETLVQRDEETYYNVGLSLKNGVRMSSWTATLRAERG